MLHGHACIYLQQRKHRWKHAVLQDYLKPLLKLLKKNKLSDDIRDSLSNVVKYILQRDYILG